MPCICLLRVIFRSADYFIGRRLNFECLHFKMPNIKNMIANPEAVEINCFSPNLFHLITQF